MSAVRTSPKDRMLAGSATALVMALLGVMLVRGLTVGMDAHREQPIALVDLHAPPPPPPPKPRPDHPKPKPAAAASRPNLRGKATPVVAPPPIVPPVAPPPIIVAPRPDVGAAASTGASDHAGTGRGAGGDGNGNGSGGDGDGDGGTPPRLLKDPLRYSDLPAGLRDAEVTGTVTVEYDVETDGRVANCDVTRSSGNGELDGATCALMEKRFRYRPARDRDGRNVPSTITDETRSWVVDHEVDPSGPKNPR